MTKIFSNAIGTSEVWAAAGGVMMWGQGSAEGSNFPLLLEAINCQFGRRVNPIFPINAFKGGVTTRIDLVGAPSGQLTCQGMVSPSKGDLETFLSRLGAGASSSDSGIWITIKPFTTGTGDSVTEQSTYKLYGVVLESLGLTIQSGEVASVRQPFQCSFIDMEIL